VTSSNCALVSDPKIAAAIEQGFPQLKQTTKELLKSAFFGERMSVVAKVDLDLFGKDGKEVLEEKVRDGKLDIYVVDAAIGDGNKIRELIVGSDHDRGDARILTSSKQHARAATREPNWWEKLRGRDRGKER
jgi:hypothetical protein